MTEIHAGPEALERRGSRIRGILGAFLGAFLGAYLSDLLLFFLFESETGRLGFLGAMLLVGWTACWGYRLLGGYRSMGFAQWTVRLGLILGQPAALAAALIRRETRRLCAAGMTMDPAALRKICLETGALLLEPDALAAIGMLVLLSLFFVRLSWGGLLKYVDPGWYHDPRRLARIGGGGATSNMPPCWPLPPAGRIPTQFEVDKGRLRVEGSVLTYKTWGKPPRSFSINDVAGVVLGVSTGYNILYDRENRMLARFTWSRKNALLFGQYLIRRGIPFVDLNGAPVPTSALEHPPHPPAVHGAGEEVLSGAGLERNCFPGRGRPEPPASSGGLGEAGIPSSGTAPSGPVCEPPSLLLQSAAGGGRGAGHLHHPSPANLPVPPFRCGGDQAGGQQL
ncbi:MAG: hypothetical protein HFF07_08030 [Oscillospiraceae bacterium]|nr:hypothetical protein [Oscillospiraceae bacterium]